MRRLGLVTLFALVGCGGGGGGTDLLFTLTANLDDPAFFYDQPWPLDTRLDATGHRKLDGFPMPAQNPKLPVLVKTAMQATAFPVVPVAYFRATAPMADRDPDAVIPADKTSPILLVDIDVMGEHGRLIPTVAQPLEYDDYSPSYLYAMAPRPGFVLTPHRRYAFVVMRALGDKTGAKLARNATVAALLAGKKQNGNDALLPLFAPLAATLGELGIKADDVASATVFTTGDVVEDLQKLSESVRQSVTVEIKDLHVDPDDGAAHPRYCELRGTVTMPQYQKGTPPFDTDGLFVFDSDGKLVKQSDLSVPLSITLPKGKMPDTGYPIIFYMHGSGGLSTAIEDRGTWRPVADTSVCPDGETDEWNGVVGCNTKGEGPAHVNAEHGFAMVNAALPINSERVPGAHSYDYVNINNLSAGRDTFRQGVIEQRLLMDALLGMKIPVSATATCTGLELPATATEFKMDPGQVYMQGQSMGGQYTNLITPVEPRVRAAVPTGAGGHWSNFLLTTEFIANAANALATLLIQTDAKLSFMHPGMHMFQQAWEPVDPIVYMPRLARRPLAGFPSRSIYEAVGKGDSYFSTGIYDAMALAYGHKQAGTEVWPTMQPALALEGLGGIIQYPVANDVMSLDGKAYTGVVVQYEGDGVYDPHALYTQLDAVKYQYGCFFATMLATNTATVPPVRALGTPCLP